jgi:hypothetical protein
LAQSVNKPDKGGIFTSLQRLLMQCSPRFNIEVVRRLKFEIIIKTKTDHRFFLVQ